MSNKMIRKCKNCELSYCVECSEHGYWNEFCCDDCYDDYEKRKDIGGVRNAREISKEKYKLFMKEVKIWKK